MLAPNPSQHLESEIPIAGNRPYRFNLPESCSNGLVDAKRPPDLAKRRTWSEAFKRQIVAETLEPGSSVSIVARRHDGLVEIVPEPEHLPRRRRMEGAGFIEIGFGCGARGWFRR